MARLTDDELAGIEASFATHIAIGKRTAKRMLDEIQAYRLACAVDAEMMARVALQLAAALRASEARAEAAEKRERAYREALKEALVVNGWPLCRIDGCEYPPTFYSVEYPSGVCPKHAPEVGGIAEQTNA